MNNIIEKLEGALSVLDTVNVPFSYIKKYKDANIYVTYFIVNTEPIGYEDDDYKYYKYDVQIDVWSKYDTDNAEVINMIINRMKYNGFILTRLGSDIYENETDLLHKAIEFTINLKKEEDN